LIGMNFIMVGGGLAMIVSFVLLPVGLLGVLLVPVWSIWLGMTLLRGLRDATARSDRSEVSV
jgi:hypothetical protein